ncbi:MAG: M48 family metalloprotease [Solirubrobacterales bacterium]|nr:M48 family metalloprotease [Solirubrobacterales bacterium]
MRDVRRSGVLGPIVIALAAAELGARLLAPRGRPRKPPEADVHAHFSAEEIERAARFARPQRALALTRMAIDLASLTLMVRRAPRVLRSQFSPPELGGVAVGGTLAVALSLPSLPVSALARRRAIAVGLDTQSWRGWTVDLVKAAGIQGALAGAGGGLLIAATRRYPRGWWLPAAAGSVLAGGLLAALSPVLLDPMFNEFAPLEEGQTRADVLELASAAGVSVGEVYSIDASRRTTAANAYVTGLGPTKRVVLFDTLLKRYSRDEIRLVVAHELAHVRHRDVPRGILFAAIVAPASALAVQRLSWALSDTRNEPAALPAIALAAALVAAPVGVIGNRLSRAIERRADAYSLELVRAPEAFVSFERGIALQNLADLQPPKWVTGLLATHPPTVERIGAALVWQGASGREPGAGEPRAGLGAAPG